MLIAWFGGFGPGLVTTLLSWLALAYVGMPSPSLMIRDPGNLMGFVLFLSVGVLLSMLTAQVLDARRRAEAVARELERESDERRTVEAVATKLATIADELQTSVDRYREQIGSLAGVFRARRDGRIVECNDLFVRLLGASSPQQVLALNVKDLFLDPAQWGELAGALTSGAVVGKELRWRRDDGAPLTVRATFREADGFVEGVAIVVAVQEPF
jgi:PAS domain-containing protein